MKFPTPKLRERQARLSRFAMEDRRKRNRRRAKANNLKSRREQSRRARPLSVKAPARLKFHGSQQERQIFFDFVAHIEEGLRSGRQVRIDLSTIERLFPCGLLLFMGHVNAWLEKYPAKVIASYPNDGVVEQMLQSVGLLESLGLENRLSEISHSDVTQWRYFTGTNADAQEMAPFMLEIRSIIGATNQSMLYDSVVEAMTNVRHHAYENPQATKWWMFATISDRSLTVAIYDSGDSIPGTLLRKPGVREFVARVVGGRRKRDAWLVEMATGGRSRTRLPYRGKGLPEMLESTRHMRGSTLGIYSRAGVFVCSAEEDPPRERSLRLDVPIVGTLILWRIELPGTPQCASAS